MRLPARHALRDRHVPARTRRVRARQAEIRALEWQAHGGRARARAGRQMHHDPPLDGGAECAAARLFGGVHRHGHPGAGPDGGGRGRAAHGRVGRGVRAHRVHRAGRPRRDGHAGAGKAHLRHRDLRRGGELLHRGRCPAARMAAPPAQRPARRAAGVGGPHHDGGRAAAPARAQRAGAGGLRRRAPADGRGAADRD